MGYYGWEAAVKKEEKDKMRMDNYDEKIDTLIKNALQVKAGDYEVQDEVKERIDQKIKNFKKELDCKPG